MNVSLRKNTPIRRFCFQKIRKAFLRNFFRAGFFRKEYKKRLGKRLRAETTTKYEWAMS